MSIRFGILGTGKIARLFAADLRTSSAVRVSVVASRDADRAAAFAREFEVPRAALTYDDLVASEDVDVVYIALPHPLHAQWVVRAATAGKHVLCEKPLAMSAAEAEEAVGAARAAGVALMEGFAYRFHPVTARVRQLLREGVIGTPRLLDATFGYNASAAENYLFRPELGGGSILDVGCYTMSLARCLAGAHSGRPFADPVVVQGAGYVAGGVDHAASASVLFADALIARLGCAINADLPDAVTIYGSDGHLRIESPWLPGRLGPVSIQYSAAGDLRREAVPSHTALYAAEAEAFADVLDRGEHPAMSTADSLGNAAALDAWRTAVRLSTPVA